MAYTPAEADRILYNSASDAIKRMSDSQIDAVSKKLQEYYALKLYESNWSVTGDSPSTGNTLPEVTYGGVYMAQSNEYSVSGSSTDVTNRGSLSDTVWNSKTISNPDDDDPTNLQSNIFGPYTQPGSYAGDDDDSFNPTNFVGQPASMTSSTQATYNCFQRTNPDYLSARTTLTSGLSPGDLNRYWGYVKANATTGFVQAEADAQKVREIIFTNVNSNIRSTSNDRWGSYYLSSSNPSTGPSDSGWYFVGKFGGANSTTAGYNEAFRDQTSAHASVTSVLLYGGSDNNSTNITYYLFQKIPQASDFSGEIAQPLRSHRFKITKVSGTAQDDEGSHAGVNDYFAYGNYDGDIGSYFYIKVQATSGNYYASSDLSNPSDSSSFDTGTTYSASHDNTNGTLYPSGSSSNGFVRVLINPRFAGSYSTNTVYKVEKVSMLREIRMPDMEYYSRLYTQGTYLGFGSTITDYNNQSAYRNDLQNSLYLIHYLYKYYTLGRYHPIYTLESTTAGTGEFNHGSIHDTKKGTSSGTTVGPTLDGSTYYIARVPSGGLVTQSSRYLNSTSDI